jgi:uncharacterized protein YukE
MATKHGNPENIRAIASACVSAAEQVTSAVAPVRSTFGNADWKDRNSAAFEEEISAFDGQAQALATRLQEMSSKLTAIAAKYDD